MNRTVTVRSRTLVWTMVGVVALLTAYWVGSTRPGVAAAADTTSTSAGTATPRITMTGTGQVPGVPDQLTFSVHVSKTSSDVSTALSDASQTVHQVLQALSDVGVTTKDVQTTGLAVHPQYTYVGGARTLTGYTASESLSVLVTDLSKAGTAISKAVDAGGNAVRVGGVRLKIGDTDKLLSQAREAAVAEAKAKAEQYAKATGTTLGSVISIHEVSTPLPRPEPVMFARADVAGAVVHIKAGTQNVKVTVQIVWSLG